MDSNLDQFSNQLEWNIITCQVWRCCTAILVTFEQAFKVKGYLSFWLSHLIMWFPYNDCFISAWLIWREQTENGKKEWNPQTKTKQSTPRQPESDSYAAVWLLAFYCPTTIKPVITIIHLSGHQAWLSSHCVSPVLKSKQIISHQSPGPPSF